jgi:hypothetical protein
MALTPFQQRICRLLAAQRIADGESYVAGGAALGVALESARLSRDIDLFHDSAEALRASWDQDRATLEGAGMEIAPTRLLPTFIEAVVTDGDESLLLQWVVDSAFRFFPLLEHPLFGLTLHPFDLATNKVLALVGRLEVRDWLDVMACHHRLQPLGLLAWAACGKDPGFNPTSLLAEAHRSNRYTALDLEKVEFTGTPPDAGVLAREWKRMLQDAEQLVSLLPPEDVGRAVLTSRGELFRGDARQLCEAVHRGELLFHDGYIGGVWPQIKGVS